MDVCPECNAPVRDAQTCEEIYGQFLSLEFVDPGYGAVHHLTVPAYMLQHPSRLSRLGWIVVRERLCGFLTGKLDIATLKAHNNHRFAQPKKGGSLKPNRDSLSIPAHIWSLTIASVSSADATTYQGDIRRWAEAIVVDSSKIAASIV